MEKIYCYFLHHFLVSVIYARVKAVCLLFTFFLLGSLMTTGQVVDSGAQWTWVSGTTTLQHRGVAATKGIAATTNVPPVRFGACSWSDDKGNLWLFGGDFNGSNRKNDLWRYDISADTWAWMSGDFASSGNGAWNRNGVYGTKGVPAATNTPGGRRSVTCWKDTAGNFWLFGGFGRAEAGADCYLNDLWQYNPDTEMWTWVSGTKDRNELGNYGVKGVPASTNRPGCRGGAWTNGASAVWVDAQNNFWLFGGHTNVNNKTDRLNDLWKYEPLTDTWTWMGGGITADAVGNYGTKGVPAATNQPGARYGSTYWTDHSGKFWLFGGSGFSRVTGTPAGDLNDLWCYDPGTNMWTWMHGSDTINVSGTYGTRGVPAANNTPGGRAGMGVGDNWVDMNGRLWLLGGAGRGDGTEINPGERLEDLWRYDPVTNMWVWMKGRSNELKKDGSYGTKGVAAPTNHPGCRYNHIRWTDSAGNFWIMAGDNPANARNDLWRLAPVAPPIPGQPGLYTQAKDSVCPGETVSFSLAPVTGAATYEWLYTGTGVTLSGGNSTTLPANNLIFSGAATGGTLRVRAVNNAGAGLYRDTSVFVSILPVVSSTNTGIQSICAGDSLLLTASGSASVSYQWKRGLTNVGTNNPDYYARTSGVYSVTVTTATNCSTTSSPVTTLTVNSLPVAVISAGGVTELCSGETVTLNAIPVSGADYQWKQGTASVGTNTSSYSANATGAYKLIVSDPSTGCSDSSSSITVTVHDRPSAILTPGDTSFCEGGLVMLKVVSQDTGLRYRWKNDTTTVPLATADFLEIRESGKYSVVFERGTVVECEDSTNEVEVIVHPLPVADIVWDDESEILHATSGYLSYRWYTSGQGIPGASDSTYVPLSPGGYSVSVTDSNDCSNASVVYNVTRIKSAIGQVFSAESLIRIYPNPVIDGRLRIEGAEGLSVRVVSIDGRIAMQEMVFSGMLDVGSLPEGLYIVLVLHQESGLIHAEKIWKDL